MTSIKNINVFELSNKRSKGKNINFNLTIDQDGGLLKQKVTRNLKNFLVERYKSYQTNSSSMDKSNHRRKHAIRLYQKIQKEYKKNLKHKKILEIGCGTGFLLQLFKKKGSQVLGIEPSKIKNTKKIKISKKFYLSYNLDTKFDLIISNAVLEHEFNPYSFLKKTFKDLKYDGMTFVCVPDYSKLIPNGDPTLINHEHISYFTKANLEFYLKKSKFSNVKVNADKFGNLYGVGFKKKLVNVFKKKKIKNYKKLDRIYLDKFNACVRKINKWINEEKGKYNLGLYGAVSSISTIFSKIKFDKKNIYIFDSDSEKHNKFIDAFPNPILSSNMINGIDLNKMLILPYHYEKEIKSLLIKKMKHNSKNIKCLSDFFKK